MSIANPRTISRNTLQTEFSRHTLLFLSLRPKTQKEGNEIKLSWLCFVNSPLQKLYFLNVIAKLLFWAFKKEFEIEKEKMCC
ncbi:hypothetical protein P8452_64563 [Trifolium repens]|nr:hypothetical protein P8452_64563 [Trifolium repens]